MYLTLLLSCSFQVTCSSSSSAWTTATPSRRCSGSSGRSTRPSRAWRTRARRTSTCPWWSAATRATGSSYREVQQAEIEQLVAGDEKCAYFEISAKRNENVDKMFQTLFTLAKLPHEMSPDLHRKVSVQYCDMLHRKSLKSKKLKDVGEAYGVVTPCARRPSVHSDLMYIKEKAIGGGQGKDKERCSIS